MSNINNRYIEDEMKESYLDYSMSVIVSRALPDVRDGMKPVHRRILFAMSELGMTYDKPFKKSARIVGEVLGKYHPHGDSAVYSTMVRMAQDFNYRYPLIAGHGNFGSIDGDSAAAMRYTEARMAKISSELMDDIDKNTVDFRKNFDDSLDEPVVLPAKLPNMLVNGATGIAVGMATNIPPHNLSEVVDGTLALIDNSEITISELIKYVKGPDFPTGGIIDGRKGIEDAYKTGRGKVRVRGKVQFESSKNGKTNIIIKEIPFQVNKSNLIEKIANLVRDKKITGITDLRDESDREGIRVVIELKKGEEPELILNKLYKYTDLRTTFGIIMLALVNNTPRILNLKEVLNEYIKHRFEVITRRVRFNLEKAEKRAHILAGFRIALENIDRIIEHIKSSNDANIARTTLIERYSFTDIQARAILDMKLQRLTGLEREKIENEHNELLEYIKELRHILENNYRIYDIMKEELIELKEKYGDKRRTDIQDSRLELTPEDLIKDEKVILTFTEKGYVKRMSLDKYKAQRRGGRGIASQNTVDDDFVVNIDMATNHETLMIFTDIGKVYNLKVYEIPETSRQSRGRLISNFINIGNGENISSIIRIRDFSDTNEVVFVTRDGMVKKTNLSEFKNINTAGLRAIRLKDDDDIIFVGLIENIDNEDIFMATKKGYSIRFNSSKLRSIGRTGIGVRGMSLREDDKVVSALLIKDPENTQILTVTENGYGKRTRITEYPAQGRNGKGILNIRAKEKIGDIVGVLCVHEDEELMAITSSGIIIRTAVSDISIYGRVSQGVIIMKLNGKNEKVVSITRIKPEDEDEEPEVVEIIKEETKKDEEIEEIYITEETVE